jgi:para-aminobenzoate synthetase/4-amino-4-deoxychorismate lyase
MFGARFDDAEAALSFALVDPLEEIVANELSSVVGAVDLAREAAASGRWVAGYIAYEAAPAFDAALTVRPGYGEPLVWFGVFGDRVVVDPPTASPPAARRYSVSRWAPAWDSDRYAAAFGEVQEHIAAGDTYQVNLTFPLSAAFSGLADEMYASLVAAQQPRYAAHVWHEDAHLLSVSPERFFAIEDGRITTRPMKGTAPRGRWTEEDETKRRSLFASEKDRAENLMIVDLLRNDLGRIAEFGSVVVDELFTIEKYQTVWQMTSEVSATLRADADLEDVFAALFPCGSVTGAPKARSMEIIADLEEDHRGPYCGAVGFIPPGDGLEGASFNVAIRTAVVDESEGVARYSVGGGITWDSSIESEYEEALTKARVLTGGPADVELIETMRWDDGYVMLEEHLKRLSSSAAYWGMPCDVNSLRSMLVELEDAMTGPTSVRVLASGDGRVVFSLSSAPERFPVGPGPADEPVHVSIDRVPVDSGDPRSFHKVADRSRFDDRRKRNVGVDDVLCVNEHGDITESTIANVAFLIDGVWRTPPVTDGLLAGILREKLIVGGMLKEQSVSIPEALGAEAVALLNSVRGWRPAVIVDRTRQ